MFIRVVWIAVVVMSVMTISDGTFVHTVETNLSEKPKAKRKKATTYHWKKAAKEKTAIRQQQETGIGKVSSETRERLYQEAYAYRGCYGMDQQDIRDWVDMKLAEFLARQPFWYGMTSGADARHRESQRQYKNRKELVNE